MKNLFFVILMLSAFISFSQESKSKFEVGLFNAYIFHLADVDLAVAPDRNYTNGNVSIKFAYHRNPMELFGFFGSCDVGVGVIERGISNSTYFKNTPDNSYQLELFLGSTLNPFHSKNIWFHVAGGINRLTIGGMEDLEVGGGPRIIFTGGDIWTKMINNLPQSGGVIAGYPKFKRVSPALNIGVNVKLLKILSIYYDYTPVLISPIRNDFSLGFSLVF